MKALKALGIALVALIALSAIVVFIPGQWIGTSKVDAFHLLENPHHLKSVEGWYSIAGDDPKVAKVLGVYYVGTTETRPYPYHGRRAWEARSWMIDDDLQEILDAQINNH